MAVLESCPKHNMVAYLEKTNANTEFHEIISFLTRSSIHYALTVMSCSPTIHLLNDLECYAKSKIINNDRFLPNQAIFDAIQLIGPSPTTHIPDSILEGSGGNHGGQSSSDRSLSGNKGGMTL
ncbi:hypothetical protein Tco_0026172 [Tanacetum coccineum]